jgi:hypothetical protein
VIDKTQVFAKQSANQASTIDTGSELRQTADWLQTDFNVYEHGQTRSELYLG